MKCRRRFFSALIAGVLTFPTPASFADILHLKNGAELEGAVVEESTNEVVIKLKDGTVSFFRDEIEKIEKKALAPVAAKNQEATGPARAVEDDKELFEYRGRKYTKERFEDLIAKKGLIRYGGHWITKHEKLGIELAERPKQLNVKKVVEYASPAVVSVRVDDSRLGSGTMINQNGLFITNWHVVKDATDIKVKLYNDKREYSARVVTYNEVCDLALVSIGGTDRPYLKLADPGGIAAGNPVIAMGNPFGLAATATTGIISSVRKLKDFPGGDSEKIERAQKELTYIQTDAAINPGNSGGPLLNNVGKVIGINSFGVQKNVAEGLNFALHAKDIKKKYSYYFE